MNRAMVGHPGLLTLGLALTLASSRRAPMPRDAARIHRAAIASSAVSDLSGEAPGKKTGFWERRRPHRSANGPGEESRCGPSSRPGH